MKKYNRSEIMSKANAIRKAYGLSKSEALRKAWAMAKLAILEKESFTLGMKDRLTNEEHALARELSGQIAQLKASIFPKVVKTRTIALYSQAELDMMAKTVASLKSYASLDFRSETLLEQLEYKLANSVQIITKTEIDENAYAAA